MTALGRCVRRTFFLCPVIMAILCLAQKLGRAIPPLMVPGGMRTTVFSCLLPVWLAVSSLFLRRTRHWLIYRTLVFLRLIIPFIFVTVELWGRGGVFLLIFFIFFLLYRWRWLWWGFSGAFVTSGFVWPRMRARLFIVARSADRLRYNMTKNAFKDCNIFKA